MSTWVSMSWKSLLETCSRICEVHQRYQDEIVEALAQEMASESGCERQIEFKRCHCVLEGILAGQA